MQGYRTNYILEFSMYDTMPLRGDIALFFSQEECDTSLESSN